ncbi:MAG: hypothetical protein HUJ95_05350 [Bacteroidales bacterium]|nr:hypothetical protein [Bacteroidales bacterium]
MAEGELKRGSRVFLSPYMVSGANDIHDLNIFVFNDFGVLERSHYINRGSPDYDKDLEKDIEFNLLYGVTYSIYAMANLGYEVRVGSLEEMKQYEFPISYPGEMIAGMPLAGRLEKVLTNEDAVYVKIPLERLFARVDLSFDRSNLDKDVDMRIASAKIVYSPKMILVFGDSKPERSEQFFLAGHIFTEDGIWKLNNKTVRDPLEIYILENMGMNNGYRPYLELYIEYLSDSLQTPTNEYLIYRAYLKDDGYIRRNCVYPLTICPQGNGLGATPDTPTWAIDASALKQRNRQ